MENGIHKRFINQNLFEQLFCHLWYNIEQNRENGMNITRNVLTTISIDAYISNIPIKKKPQINKLILHNKNISHHHILRKYFSYIMPFDYFVRGVLKSPPPGHKVLDYNPLCLNVNLYNEKTNDKGGYIIYRGWAPHLPSKTLQIALCPQ